MSRDDIIELARQSGARDDGWEFRFVEPRYLERFVELVSFHQRKACARAVMDNAHMFATRQAAESLACDMLSERVSA